MFRKTNGTRFYFKANWLLGIVAIFLVFLCTVSAFGKEKYHEKMAFIIGERVCPGDVSVRGRLFFTGQDGVRIGDTHHQVATQAPASQKILQMIVMKHLETSVNDAGIELYILFLRHDDPWVPSLYGR